MSRIRLFVTLFVAVLVVSPGQAGDPWIDHSIEIDREAELEILGDQLGFARQLLLEAELKFSVGTLKATDAMQARVHYFRALSMLNWGLGDFEESYRAAEYALIASKKAVALMEAERMQGTTTLALLAGLQQRGTEIRLVLLRFEAEARRRGIQHEPATEQMMNAALEAARNDRESNNSENGNGAGSALKRIFGDAPQAPAPED